MTTQSDNVQEKRDPKEFKTYRDLKVWRKGVDLATGIHRLTREFPKEEIFSLASPMRTCAVDISAAIADGNAKALRIAAHTLKGSMRYFGAGRGYEYAFELEQMGQQGSLGSAASAFAKLQGEMARLTPILVDYL